jgi:hypothetical protein
MKGEGVKIDGLLASWRTAEERLYPVVMVRPDLYERAVWLVGQLAAELRQSCPDVASLVSAEPRVAAMVEQLEADNDKSLAGLDVSLIAAAACSFRYRELAVDAARDERIAAIHAAAARGERWLVVDQSGTPDSFSIIPFTKVEMHVPSGRALQQTVETDPGTGQARFLVEEVERDPRTGDRTEAASRSPHVEEFDDIDAWVLAIGERKRAVEQGS